MNFLFSFIFLFLYIIIIRSALRVRRQARDNFLLWLAIVQFFPILGIIQSFSNRLLFFLGEGNTEIANWLLQNYSRYYLESGFSNYIGMLFEILPVSILILSLLTRSKSKNKRDQKDERGSVSNVS